VRRVKARRRSSPRDKPRKAPVAPAPGGAGSTDHSRAYDALKQTVLSGGFGPGEVVTLRALSERLGFGDTPVREAVKRLVSEGAFEAMPNRSARVPSLTGRDIEQLLELRANLEGQAAALAAHNINLHQIEHLRTLHDGMATALATGDSVAYGELNMAFHFEIYRIADNPALSTLIEVLWLRMASFVRRARALVDREPTKDARRLMCGHHELLLSAFQKRDAEAARTAMRDDILSLVGLPGYWDGLSRTRPAGRSLS
jgi:DNA-binding GntR family transcriptional regulator